MVPEPGSLSPNDQQIIAAADAMLQKTRQAMETQQIHQALNIIWAVVAETNRYFAGEAPWALRKKDPVRFATVLWTTAEVTRQLAILTQPFAPGGAAKLLDILGIDATERDFSFLGKSGRLKAGSVLHSPIPVFPRYIGSDERAN
jgi:methionyl-tRNA synthetase